MGELTDLEMTEKLADIVFGKENTQVFHGYVYAKNKNSDGAMQLYLPCAYGENCKLRDEFEVYINYFLKTVKIYNKAFDKDDGIKLSEVYFKEKKDINKAVFLAIIEAFG